MSFKIFIRGIWSILNLSLSASYMRNFAFTSVWIKRILAFLLENTAFSNLNHIAPIPCSDVVLQAFSHCSGFVQIHLNNGSPFHLLY